MPDELRPEKAERGVVCNSDKDQEETRQELPKVRETCTTVEGDHLPAKREEEVSMGFEQIK